MVKGGARVLSANGLERAVRNFLKKVGADAAAALRAGAYDSTRLRGHRMCQLGWYRRNNLLSRMGQEFLFINIQGGKTNDKNSLQDLFIRRRDAETMV